MNIITITKDDAINAILCIDHHLLNYEMCDFVIKPTDEAMKKRKELKILSEKLKEAVK